MNFGLPAVQAGSRPGRAIGQSLPYVPGETRWRVSSHSWVCGAVRCASGRKPVYGGPWVPGAERARVGVTCEVQVTDFLCDNVQLLAVVNTLYLSAEDLVKRHVLKVEGGPDSNGCAAGGSCDSVSATGTYTRRLVYSDMNAR